MTRSSVSKISFGKRFLEDHVGPLIDDPYLAFVELIANSYDAGATSVKIVSPSEKGHIFSVSDNGIGMTPTEFSYRWNKLAYSRTEEQGDDVVFPPNVQGRRKVLGRSGKGRHGAFCFSDGYRIETHKDSEHFAAIVNLTRGDESPFTVTPAIPAADLSHGTIISGVADRNFVVESKLREIIGSKFLVDPSFSIVLNGQPIDLFALRILNTETIQILNEANKLIIHRIALDESDADSQMRGVTWWVNRRMVSRPDWRSFSGESYLDARKSEAKRFSFVIEADFLKPWVKEDWSGFHSMPLVAKSLEAVDEYVRDQIYQLLAGDRRRSKEKAIRQNSQAIGDLPVLSKYAIGQFIDEVQQKCSTLSERDLAKTVEIYAALEQCKFGYDILNQLASCSPDDLDTWNIIMKEWSATNASIVLGELHRRLALISRITSVVSAAKADELHEIHPLFDRGLWIFGPEYESVDFTSNRGMAHVVKTFFGKKGVQVSQRRPDIIAVPSSTISVYGAPAFDENGMISGSRSVIIVELKATGVPITTKEIDQARDYCEELYATGAVAESVQIRAFVLGTSVKTREMEFGSAKIIPRPYAVILENAHARTFNLHQRLRDERPFLRQDLMVEDLAGDASFIRMP